MARVRRKVDSARVPKANLANRVKVIHPARTEALRLKMGRRTPMGIPELAAAAAPEVRIRRTLAATGNARTMERTIEARVPSTLVTTPLNRRRSIHNRQGSLKRSLIYE